MRYKNFSDGLQIAVTVEPRGRERCDELGRRLVGDKMPGELGRQVSRRGRMHGQVSKDGFALLDATVCVTFAEHSLRAGLVHCSTKIEGPDRGAVVAAGIALVRDRPAGDDLCERRDVGLRVTAVDAECVQLQDFARQILVEAEIALRGAAGGPFAGARAGAHRALIVEVRDHRRVLHSGA